MSTQKEYSRRVRLLPRLPYDEELNKEKKPEKKKKKKQTKTKDAILLCKINERRDTTYYLVPKELISDELELYMDEHTIFSELYEFEVKKGMRKSLKDELREYSHKFYAEYKLSPSGNSAYTIPSGYNIVTIFSFTTE